MNLKVAPDDVLGYKTMRTITKLFAAFSIAVAGTLTASAQGDYLLNYGPGSPSWCWQMQQGINAMRMQNAMMQQQILNYYQQQAAATTQWMQTTPCTPMPGVLTYDGVYVTPETVNNYHKENVSCEHCNGGYNYRNVYIGGGKTRQVKSRCNWRHGKRYITKTVRND